MSINRLKLYLKSKQQEIIDYWVENTSLCYVRVIHISSGNVYFLNVGSFSIVIDSSLHEFNDVYFIIKVGKYEEDYSEQLIVFYDMIHNLFPQYSTQTILHYKKYLIEDRDTIYKVIHNNNISSLFLLYPIFSLEWFYEHCTDIEKIMSPLTKDVIHKTNDVYITFLNSFENFFKTSQEHLNLFQQTHSNISEKTTLYHKYSSLFIKMHIQEKIFLKEIKNLEDYSTSYTVNDTNFKIQKRTAIKKKLSELQSLKVNIRNNLLQSRDDMFHFRLYFIYFLNEMKSSLSRFQTLLIDYKSEFT
jgi:hypothetical protein